MTSRTLLASIVKSMLGLLVLLSGDTVNVNSCSTYLLSCLGTVYVF